MITDALQEPENPLPREIAPGLFWLGACLIVTQFGRPQHTYNSVYLVSGDECSILVEGGLGQHVPVVEAQLIQLLEAGVPPLRYVFLTHTETPHSACVGRVLERFPDVTAVGDVSDMHLVFPRYADRFRYLEVGDSVDLGGRRFEAVESVFRDMRTSRWGFDTGSRALFTGDGVAYAHFHEAGQCGCLAEETVELEISDMTKRFAESAFYWTGFQDLNPYADRLNQLVFKELEARIIAPTHGLPIGDPAATFPAVIEGLGLVPHEKNAA